MNQFEEIKLTPEEKVHIRTALTHFMRQHPKRNGIFGRLFLPKLPFTVPLLIKDMSLALIFVLLILSGTSFAAQDALPGNMLYPIKIVINEELRGAFAITAESRAEWETMRAKRRIEEARVLLAQNKLTTETKTTLQTRLEQHVGHAVKLATELTEKNNYEAALRISSNLENSLKISGRTLHMAMTQAGGNTQNIARSLVDVAEVKAEQAAATRMAVEMIATKSNTTNATFDIKAKKSTEANVK